MEKQNIKIKNYTTDGKVTHYSKLLDINEKLSLILGKKFSDYRKKWDEVNNLNLETEFPLFLHVELNQKCNYLCPHCIIGNLDEVKKFYPSTNAEINFNDYKKIVDEGASYNCPSISPQGDNEPLLIKNFEDYLYYAHKKNFIDIMFNTNGSPLTKKRAQKILDSGVTRVRISLDAHTDDTYKKVRVGSIDLEKVHRNIFQLLELKEKGNYQLPIIGVSFCKMKTNEHEVKVFEDFWRDKVDFVSIQSYVPPTLNKKKYFDFYTDDQIFENEKQKFRCNQPYQRVVIRNHKIYPCCVTHAIPGDKDDHNLVIGNLKETSIFNAWNSEKMKKLRKIQKSGEYKKNNICISCVKSNYPTKKIISEFKENAN